MQEKVSVVIPIYKPDYEILKKLKQVLNKQTVPVEIIEKWNNPEAVSMNFGIKEAKGNIIIILAQDCIPENKYWVEKMIAPLKNKEVSAVVSDLLLPEFYWKKRPFLVRLFTISDLKLRKPSMNLSSCAYRKNDLEKIGYIDENSSAIDLDFSIKISKIGKVVRANAIVYHVHPHNNYRKTLKTFYNYSKFNGIAVKDNGIMDISHLQRVIRATPVLGICAIYFRYPIKKYWYWIPLHVIISATVEHMINIIGFGYGFLLGEEEGGERNKEVIHFKKNNTL